MTAYRTFWSWMMSRRSAIFLLPAAEKGYRVTPANSGRQALDLLKQHRFNVALVDLKLPDLNGLEILREIKKVQPACEVIIITGYSTVKSAVEAISPAPSIT